MDLENSNSETAPIRDQYCVFPFENVEANSNGKLYFCCSSWQTKPFGDFVSHTISEEWNSANAQDIRASIIDGSYKYCNKNCCPYLHAGNLKKFSDLSENQKTYFTEKKVVIENPPTNLMLNYDQSCNLACESCRLEKISYNVDSPEYKNLKNLTEKCIKDFFEHSSGHPLRLNITGSGDPFASVVFRQFLEELDGSKFPNLTIDLQTNGVLFTPIMWSRLHKIHKNIGQVIVSVDAATEKNYLIVRKGGNWNQLLSNIEFLRGLREKNNIESLQVNMIVQKRNYFEMLDFIKMFDVKWIDCIYFSLIVDWGTWEKKIFNHHAVWQETNSEYKTFMKILTSPFLERPSVVLSNLTELREKALVDTYNQLTALGKMNFFTMKYIRLYFVKFINLFILCKKILLNEREIFKN